MAGPEGLKGSQIPLAEVSSISSPTTSSQVVRVDSGLGVRASSELSAGGSQQSGDEVVRRECSSSRASSQEFEDQEGQTVQWQEDGASSSDDEGLDGMQFTGEEEVWEVVSGGESEEERLTEQFVEVSIVQEDAVQGRILPIYAGRRRQGQQEEGAGVPSGGSEQVYVAWEGWPDEYLIDYPAMVKINERRIDDYLGNMPYNQEGWPAEMEGHDAEDYLMKFKAMIVEEERGWRHFENQWEMLGRGRTVNNFLVRLRNTHRVDGRRYLLKMPKDASAEQVHAAWELVSGMVFSMLEYKERFGEEKIEIHDVQDMWKGWADFVQDSILSEAFTAEAWRKAKKEIEEMRLEEYREWKEGNDMSSSEESDSDE